MNSSLSLPAATYCSFQFTQQIQYICMVTEAQTARVRRHEAFHQEAAGAGTLSGWFQSQALSRSHRQCCYLHYQPVNEDVTPVLLQTSYAVPSTVCQCAHRSCGRSGRLWPCASPVTKIIHTVETVKSALAGPDDAGR